MLLALDFDGVVADGLHECLLVAWNVFHEQPLIFFDKKALAAIPPDFVKRFRYLRNFVRHDGHFRVPFCSDAQTIRTQRDFDEIYRSISATEQSAFRDRFIDYRLGARATKTNFWMDLHVIHKSLIDAIPSWSKVRIVSGKDTESIDALLRFKGITMPLSHIFGRMTSKVNVLKNLKLEVADNLLFCDDNIWNVLEARELGINTIWAQWGFHTPDHMEEARKNSISAHSLEDFIKHIMTDCST